MDKLKRIEKYHLAFSPKYTSGSCLSLLLEKCVTPYRLMCPNRVHKVPKSIFHWVST